MSNRTEPTVCGGPLHSAPSLAVPHREQQNGIADYQLSERKNLQGSSLATTNALKMGYGAVVFWIVVAALVAARVAFLDPNKVQSNSPLFGAKATSTSTTHERPAQTN